MSADRSSSTPPECQKCGMGMLVATKEQFAARICGSCERSSTPRAGTAPHEHRFNDVGSCVICGIAALYRCSTHGYAYDESCCGEDWRQTHLSSRSSSTPPSKENEMPTNHRSVAFAHLQQETDALLESVRHASSPPPSELLSIRDADTGESEMHIRRVPDGFSLQVQQRGADDYLSVILIPDTARELRDYLASNLPSPETRAGLNTLIDGLLATNTLRHPLHPELTAARAALVSLYDRQREEISQRDEDFGVLEDQNNALIDCNASLSSQLERLKAEQISPTQARWLLKHAHIVATWPELAESLRRLQSRGTTDV